MEYVLQEMTRYVDPTSVEGAKQEHITPLLHCNLHGISTISEKQTGLPTLH